MKTCSKETTFLKIINFSKVTSLLEVIVFLAEVTYFARSIYVKVIGTTGTCFRDTSTCASSACIRGIDSAYSKGACIEVNCAKDTGGVNAIKGLGTLL